MTDVPRGAGWSGDDADPWEPSGARRSSFQPPEPSVDDDALADALAAQVSAFAPPPVETGTPAAAPAPADVPAPVDVSDDFGTQGAASTLEAIERLESELRRRAEARALADGTPLPEAFREATPAAPAPPVAPEIPAAPVVPSVPATADDGRPRWEIPVLDARDAEDPVPPVPPVVAPPPVDITVPADTPPLASPFAPPPAVEMPVPTFDPPVVAEPAQPPVVGDLPTFAPPTAAPPPLVEPPTWPGQGAPATGPVDLPPPMTAPLDLPPPPGAAPVALPPPPEIEAPEAVAPVVPEAASPEPAFPEPGVPEPAYPGVPPAAAASAPSADPFAEIFGRGEGDIVDADVLDPEPAAGEPAGWSLGDTDLADPASAPVPTAEVIADEELPVLVTTPHPALRVERAGPEPTALELRAGRATRLFWLNFAAGSSVLGVAVGALVLAAGASPRQAVVAVLVGVVLSFFPLGVVTVAAARSGQPTMIASRATFGLVGNAVPALLALVSRIYWGGALLWALATGVAGIVTDAGLGSGLDERLWSLIGLGVGGLIAISVAIVGYGLLARVQLVASILAALLVAGVIVLTLPALDLAAVQQLPDGSWVGSLVAGSVLVFSVVGLAWVHSAGDLARYQRPDSDRGAGALMASLGATIPPLALAGWGVLLAASDSRIATGLATDPLYTIAALLPVWYPAPLLAALAVGLVAGVTLTMYSAGFAVQALGLPVRRSVATALGAVLVLAAGAALVLLVGDAAALLRDGATTVGVPVAAWTGVFAADVLLRRRRLHGSSLLRLGGLYPAIRVVNVLVLLAATAVGFGLTTADQAGLDWQGYLWPFLGLDDATLLASDAGVLVALGMALVLALAAGLPGIRRQERADLP